MRVVCRSQESHVLRGESQLWVNLSGMCAHCMRHTLPRQPTLVCLTAPHTSPTSPTAVPQSRIAAGAHMSPHMSHMSAPTSGPIFDVSGSCCCGSCCGRALAPDASRVQAATVSAREASWGPLALARRHLLGCVRAVIGVRSRVQGGPRINRRVRSQTRRSPRNESQDAPWAAAVIIKRTRCV